MKSFTTVKEKIVFQEIILPKKKFNQEVGNGVTESSCKN